MYLFKYVPENHFNSSQKNFHLISFNQKKRLLITIKFASHKADHNEKNSCYSSLQLLKSVGNVKNHYKMKLSLSIEIQIILKPSTKFLSVKAVLKVLKCKKHSVF